MFEIYEGVFRGIYLQLSNYQDVFNELHLFWQEQDLDYKESQKELEEILTACENLEHENLKGIEMV